MNNKNELMVSVSREVLKGWAAKLTDDVAMSASVSSQINALILQSAGEVRVPRAMDFEAYLYEYDPAKSTGKDNSEKYLDTDVQFMYDVWQRCASPSLYFTCCA